MMMRKAKAEDIDELNALCFRSKAVWGYDDAFMEACREELSLDPQEIDATDIAVVELDGKIVGMAQIEFDGEEAELKRIFIDPAVLKSGIGRQLFAWAVDRAREHGGRVLGVDADPFAASFYRKMGMRDIGISSSGSIPGRYLPRLRLDL